MEPPQQEPSFLPSTNDTDDDKSTSAVQWTTLTILQALGIFIASGFAEIGGGWLVWQTMRNNKPYWWAILGSLILLLYGFLPTFQPVDSFGRIYAVYGGFFILLSFLFGWVLDGDKPDM